MSLPIYELTCCSCLPEEWILDGLVCTEHSSRPDPLPLHFMYPCKQMQGHMFTGGRSSSACPEHFPAYSLATPAHCYAAGARSAAPSLKVLSPAFYPGLKAFWASAGPSLIAAFFRRSSVNAIALAAALRISGIEAGKQGETKQMKRTCVRDALFFFHALRHVSAVDRSIRALLPTHPSVHQLIRRCPG